MEKATPRNAGQLQLRRTNRSTSRAGVDLLEWPADHVEREPRRVDLARAIDGDQPPVSQNGDPIGQLEDLVEAMRNVQNGDALRPQPPQMGKESSDLRLAQAGGRLVEDQQPRAASHRAGDSHLLFFRRRQFLDHAVCFDRNSKLSQPPACFSMQSRPIDAAPNSTRPTLAEQQILGHRQMRKALQFLLYGRDACGQRIPRRRECHRVSAETDRSAIRRLNAAQ